jgi:hypothetical protein
MSIPIILLISASVSSVRPAGREGRHPVAAGKSAMLDWCRFAVERIPAAGAAESRRGGVAARPV